MHLNIREATLEDILFLEKLEEISFSEDRQSTRRSLRLSITSEHQNTFIGEVTDQHTIVPVASMILCMHKRTLRILSIAVTSEYQGLKLGLQMMSFAEDFAQRKGAEKISLEADSSNVDLIQWYKLQGYRITDHLVDYYSEGSSAYRMVKSLQAIHSKEPIVVKNNGIHNLIVYDQWIPWLADLDSVELVTTDAYLSDPAYQRVTNARVFNFCSSYKYQSLGYYVSLLASARDHRAIPNVITIRDFSYASILRTIGEDIEELLQDSLKNMDAPVFVLHVYFGYCKLKSLGKLAREIYNLFESPYIEVTFVKTDIWWIKKVVPLPVSSIPVEDHFLVSQFAQSYFSQKRFKKTKFKPYKYNLAILIDPDEKMPPSCPIALEKFKAAGQKMDFYVDFISKKDYNRICEYDALFIRVTTDVNDYTYQFSRHAYAEGLVVIDDPWSILRCSNKMYLDERMRKGNIKTPASWTFMKKDLKHKKHLELTYPVVLKLPDSCFSKGVYKVDSPEACKAKLTEMFRSSELIIAQEYLQSDYDWRIGILDNKPLYACRYFMAHNHWQIIQWNENGENEEGETETVPIDQVPEPILRTAVKAASMIGDGLYGIDLKEVNGEAYLIEINDNPNIDADIEDAVLGEELYLRIMRSLFDRIELYRNTPRYISK